MGGDRFGSLPFSSLSGCSGSHFCIACAHAVTVVGTDFALPLLQVQRGKHMGFSRYFLLAPSACCSLPLSISLCSHPNICPRFSLVIALEKQCQACFPRSCFHGQLDPALQKSNSQSRFPLLLFFFQMQLSIYPGFALVRPTVGILADIAGSYPLLCSVK